MKKLIFISFGILFAAVPLFFTSVNFELFEFNKILTVYLFTAIISALWLTRMIYSKRIINIKTPFDIPLYLFLLSQFISFLFSIDQHTSFWGYYSRFNGGLLSLLAYAILFKAFVSNIDRDQSVRLLLVTLITGVVVSVYGILEHFGHSFSCLMFTDKFDVTCWVQDVQNRVFATVGQPNWLAAYLTVLIPITWGLTLSSKFKVLSLKFTVYSLLFTVYFVCLLFTKSRSGFLGFAASFLIFWPVMFLFLKKQVLKPLLIITTLTLFFTFIIGSPISQLDRYLSLHIFKIKTPTNQLPNQQPNSPPVTSQPQLEIGGTESGQIRKIVWQGAWEIFKHYPLFGTGPETFAYSYYQFRPIEHNLVSEWDFLYNKAHNEYLNYLATTGAFGMLTYLIFIGSFFLFCFGYIKKRNIVQKTDGENPFQVAVIVGFVSAELGLLVSNFFGFSVVLSNLYLFLIPAYAFVYFNHEPNNEGLTVRSSTNKYLLLLPIIMVVYSAYLISRLWQADYHYNQADKFSKQNTYLPAYQAYIKAIDLFPSEPVFQIDMANSAANLSYLSASNGDATTASQLKEIALAYADSAYKISPRNMNLLKTRIKIFYALSLTDKQYENTVLNTLEEASKYAPTDPKIVYNLGLMYGKLGQAQKAVETVEKAVKMKPNYMDARSALSLYYEDLKWYEKAIEQLEYITKYINPDNQSIIDRTNELRKKL